MTEFDVTSLTGRTVVDAAGDRIGTVAQVYLDDRTGDPQWVTVRTGRDGTETFVPLAAARLDRDRLVVDATREQVARAPRVAQDHLSAREEAEIYRYYGFSPGPQTGPQTGPETGPDRVGDDAMTRSEEHLVAGTREAETRVRLRKYVVTEMATVQVPVRREEVRLEHEPVPDVPAAGGSVTEVTDATDEDREVILHAERPVVTTETVPVERVRLGKETVTGTETVSGEVRREKIELDDPTR
ncbi:MAG TPA: PRC and DUF2382 domain-containing protein [Mycobacteriales bacterium]